MPMRGICTTISIAYWTTGKKVHDSKERLKQGPIPSSHEDFSVGNQDSAALL